MRDKSTRAANGLALGMDADITRRDFVSGALIGSGALLLGAPSPAAAQGLNPQWDGYAGIGDYARSNGNTAAVVNAAHGIRDQLYEAEMAVVPLVDDLYDLVIVGGGFAGLIAAYEFHKAHPDKRCLILENHPIFGGEAKQNDVEVDGVTLTAPQGSSEAIIPGPDNRYSHVSDLWDEIGLPRSYDYVQATGTAANLQFTSDVFTRAGPNEFTPALGYFFDKPFASKRSWVADPWSDDLQRAPLPAKVRDDWVRWKKHAPKITRGDADATDRWLDSISYGDLLVRELGMSEDIFKLTDPFIATANFGVSVDALSGYAAKMMSLPGTREPRPPKPASTSVSGTFSYPGGNTGILRHIVKALIPEAITGSPSFADILSAPIDFAALDRPQPTRIRLNATVAAVKHDGDPETSAHVDVSYAVGNALQRVRARAVIVTAGGWVARHIVRDLPPSYALAFSQFHHAPILVANVALRNWESIARLGITSARWFDGFGFFVNVRRPMVVGDAAVPLDPSKPTMLTFYVGYPKAGLPVAAQTASGRADLFGATYAELELQVREQLQRMFGPTGFDARRDIAAVIFNRWGHAYMAPQPGFYFGTDGNPPPLEVVRKRHGRIAFGHSELSGRQSWGRAASEGRRALEQLLEVIA